MTGRMGPARGRAGVMLFLLAVAVSPAYSAGKPAKQAVKPLKVEVGGGVIIQDLASDSGGVGPDPRGIFLTVGLVQKRGLVFRLNAGISSDELFSFTDLGLGAEPTVDSYDLTRLEASVGYVFNQRGLVRLFVHGGYSLITVEETLKGNLSGLGRKQIDDSATAISLGAGVEIGDGHHILIFDLGADPRLEFKTIQGTTAKFNMGGVYAGYVYQF